jgi:RNA polymerase sigma factor (sigma-70 family)
MDILSGEILHYYNSRVTFTGAAVFTLRIRFGRRASMIKTELEFERIYLDHYKRVYAFLLKLCRDTQAAEDLTQETFYQAYKSLSRYNGQCEMFTWLAAIGKNMFFKYLRKIKSESLVIDLFDSDLAAPLTEEPGYRIMREVEVAQVRDAISSIPKKYSEVLILRIYGELSYEEIAKKLGISVNSAKVIFFRAKNHIREVLLRE